MISRDRTPAATDAATTPVALVIDATSREGAAIAVALAWRGWDLALHRTPGTGDDPAPNLATIHGLGRRAVVVDAALLDDGAARALVDRTTTALGSPTCLVANARFRVGDDARTLDGTSLDAHVRHNLTTPILLARALHRSLPKGQRGIVVNLIDPKFLEPDPEDLSSMLTNDALHRATAFLARAFAPTLRVVAVAARPAAAAKDAAEIAASVCYLVEAATVTGSTLAHDTLASSRALLETASA